MNSLSWFVFLKFFFFFYDVPPSIGAKGLQSRPLSAFSSSLISPSRPHELRLFCSKGFVRAGPTVWRVAPHRCSVKACLMKCSKLQVSLSCYHHALLLFGWNNVLAILSDLLWKIPIGNGSYRLEMGKSFEWWATTLLSHMPAKPS